MARPKRAPRPIPTGAPGRLPTNRDVVVIEQRATGLHTTKATIRGRLQIGPHHCIVLQLRKGS